MSKKLTYEEVFNRFKERGYILLEKEYVSSKTRMECVDSEGYKYDICNNLLQNNRTSDRFGVLNPYTVHNIRNFLKINSNGSEFIGDKFEGSKSTIRITCEKCGKVMELKWSSLLNKKDFKCVSCKENKRKYSFDFIKEEFRKHGLEIISDEYIGNDIPLYCKNKEGYIVRICYSNIKNSKNPNIFSIKHNKEFYIENINKYFNINKINCEAMEIYKIGKSNYETSIKLKCECGEIFYTNFDSIRDGQERCTYCSKTMSNMEYKIRKWFDENNIDYIFQHRFYNCKNIRPLPFDFYLPKYNCCLEVDGQQHFFPSKFSNSQDVHKEFEKRKRHDNIKTEYCKKNNIKLLRISFKDIRRKNNNYIEILSKEFGQK